MNESKLHVVFGAGQVGFFLAESLLRSGARVRVVKRSAGDIPKGAELCPGDATDKAFCLEATRGAQVVYNCMNPAYSAKVWEEVLPKHLENLISSAGSANARLVVLENLYMVGTGGGDPIHENTPVNPRSRKGEIRARMAERLFDAHRRGEVRAVSGRASDFYGPRGVGTHFADRFWKPALAGKPAEFIPNPDNPHTYHYIPDVAEGLRQLGSAPEEALGGPWMLTCNPARPTRKLVEQLSAALSRPITLKGMPRVAIKLLGVVMPIVREVEEMLHQWEVPFEVDDSRFRAQFGMEATDPVTAAEATVQWAKETFGASS